MKKYEKIDKNKNKNKDIDKNNKFKTKKSTTFARKGAISQKASLPAIETPSETNYHNETHVPFTTDAHNTFSTNKQGTSTPKYNKTLVRNASYINRISPKEKENSTYAEFLLPIPNSTTEEFNLILQKIL